MSTPLDLPSSNPNEVLQRRIRRREERLSAATARVRSGGGRIGGHGEEGPPGPEGPPGADGEDGPPGATGPAGSSAPAARLATAAALPAHTRSTNTLTASAN